ncbi:hypothetical protein AB0C34_17405 [Nocardia sp. NPDC049220]|uniref:hypothetical protein n=1 Tax=Nocardia sp. NPDC049220 TaxID=3155273 RepID=UPI0033DE6DA6
MFDHDLLTDPGATPPATPPTIDTAAAGGEGEGVKVCLLCEELFTDNAHQPGLCPDCDCENCLPDLHNGGAHDEIWSHHIQITATTIHHTKTLRCHTCGRVDTIRTWTEPRHAPASNLAPPHH